jgi:hypothetical protein
VADYLFLMPRYEAFDAYYRRTGFLPTGFFNAPPGGHFNEAGQPLVAEALLRHFSGGGE